LLSPSERKKLRRIVRRHREAHRLVLRAQLILRLSHDRCVSAAAQALGMDLKLARYWRDRFLQQGRLKALYDRPRTGRPVRIDAVTRCEVIAMACGRPADFGEPCRQLWTLDALLVRFRKTHPEVEISRSSIVRILNQAHLRPHRVRMWLHSPDPHFRQKVTEICGLYLNPPKDALLLCIDEKTGMQALGRKHPVKWAQPGREGRFDYEYVRNGTRKLLAAFNPHTGHVDAEVRKHRKAKDLLEFMESLARKYPKVQVHIIWDNLNIHFDGKDRRWTQFNRRHGNRFHFHYTPIHASWVNQVEIFFGILHKRLLRYGVFDSLKALDKALLAFIRHWNRHEAHPFRWTFKGYPTQTDR
jgi:transposase